MAKESNSEANAIIGAGKDDADPENFDPVFKHLDHIRDQLERAAPCQRGLVHNGSGTDPADDVRQSS